MRQRLTKATRNLMKAIAEKFATLHHDRDIDIAFSVAAYPILIWLGIPHPRREAAEAAIASPVHAAVSPESEAPALAPHRVPPAGEAAIPVPESELHLNLLDVIKAKRPDVSDIIGTHIPFFRFYMLSQLLREAQDDRAKEVLANLLEQSRLPTYELEHFADNPISLERDPATGKPILTDLEAAEFKHFAQIMAYLRSLRPERASGRPKGQPKPHGSGKREISTDEARRVYQASQDGLDDRQIARRVLHWPIPTDPKGWNRMRQRIHARKAKGARLARNPKK